MVFMHKKILHIAHSEQNRLLNFCYDLAFIFFCCEFDISVETNLTLNTSKTKKKKHMKGRIQQIMAELPIV